MCTRKLSDGGRGAEGFSPSGVGSIGHGSGVVATVSHEITLGAGRGGKVDGQDAIERVADAEAIAGELVDGGDDTPVVGAAGGGQRERLGRVDKRAAVMDG